MRPPPMTVCAQYAVCLAGRWPAEVLPTAARDRLVRQLHGWGWTDAQIAIHTFMTTYTTARIRTRIGLAANIAQKGAA